MKTRSAIGVAIMALSLAGWPNALPASSIRGVRVENGLLVNIRAGYYFSMPEGWVLRDGSDYRTVTVVHPSSGGEFIVDYDRARGNATMYHMALIMSLESPSSGWVIERKGGLRVGGLPGSEVQGTHPMKDRGMVADRILVFVNGEFVYNISFSVPLEQARSSGPVGDQIISSFGWGKPPKSEGTK